MGPLGVALLLMAAAVLLVAAGVVVIMVAALRGLLRGRAQAEGGAVLIVGPLPLAIATSERAAKPLVLLAIALTAFAVAVTLLLSWALPRLLKP